MEFEWCEKEALCRRRLEDEEDWRAGESMITEVIMDSREANRRMGVMLSRRSVRVGARG